MPGKGYLVHTFAARSSSKDDDDALYPCPAGTPLTVGEIALVKGIFGDEIETGCIRKYFSAKEKPGTIAGYIIPAQTFGEDSIKFYGSQYHAPDYSKTSDIFNFGTFIHEMTHIWQNQQKVPAKVFDASSPYQYILTPHSMFDDFGWEQQARIIEDYARQNLHANPAAQSGPLLQKVVEDRFPQARLTRLAQKMQGKNLSKTRHRKFG